MPVTLRFRLVADGVTAAGLFAGLVAADELTADRRGENSAARELRFESAHPKKRGKHNIVEEYREHLHHHPWTYANFLLPEH